MQRQSHLYVALLNMSQQKVLLHEAVRRQSSGGLAALATAVAMAAC